MSDPGDAPALTASVRKYGSLGGVAFAVFAVISTFIRPADPFDSPEAIATAFTDDGGLVLLSVQMNVLAALSLLTFTTWLAYLMRSAGGRGLAPRLVTAGGTVGAGVYLTAATLRAAGAYRADEAGGIGLEAASTIWDISTTLFYVAAPAAAALAVAGFAVAVISGSFPMPSWLGYGAAVLAVGLVIVPIAWVAGYVLLVWILAVAFFGWTTFRTES